MTDLGLSIKEKARTGNITTEDVDKILKFALNDRITVKDLNKKFYFNAAMFLEQMPLRPFFRIFLMCTDKSKRNQKKKGKNQPGQLQTITKKFNEVMDIEQAEGGQPEHTQTPKATEEVVKEWNWLRQLRE